MLIILVGAILGFFCDRMDTNREKLMSGIIGTFAAATITLVASLLIGPSIPMTVKETEIQKMTSVSDGYIIKDDYIRFSIQENGKTIIRILPISKNVYFVSLAENEIPYVETQHKQYKHMWYYLFCIAPQNTVDYIFHIKN